MIRATLIFSLVLLCGTFVWNYLVPEDNATVLSYFMILYFALSTLVVHRFLMKINERSAKDFVRAYMGSTALRLFVNLMVIVVGIVVDKANGFLFSLTFLFYYFCFLIFEVICLQKDLKGK